MRQTPDRRSSGPLDRIAAGAGRTPGWRIYTMSWSPSGPAAYAIALQETTAVSGSYVAMSVFRPATLPPVTRAKGRLFLIEHSPQDKVCPYRDAETALR